MYRFALRPRWLFAHAAALALVAVFVNLGFWQLDRLEERREHNALVASRAEEVVTLPAEGWQEAADVDVLAFRRVRLKGSYQPSKEVLVRFRSNQGLPGYHVLTPLETERGTIVVNRGWVPQAMGDRWPDARAAAPPGVADITGLLRSSERADRLRPQGPTKTEPLSVGAVNVAGLERRLSMSLYPLYLELDGPKPAKPYPAPLPSPALGEGPHLAYAAQWFIFAAGAAGGWILLLRISARRRLAMAGATVADPS